MTHARGVNSCSLSILICTIRPDLARFAIEAVVQQTFANWELIVVDQSHTDELVAFLKELADERVRHIPDSGIGKSRALNLGIFECKGAIVACTDDDCIPRPDWAEQILAAFDENSGLAMVGGPVLPPPDAEESGELFLCPHYIGGDFAWNGGPGCSDFVLNKTVHGIMGANVSYRRDALLNDVGLFDTYLGPGAEFPSGEDRDISIRIWKAGLGFATNSKAVVEHKFGTRRGSEVPDYLKTMHRSKGALAAKHLLLGDMITYKHFLRQEGLAGGFQSLKAALDKDRKIGVTWTFVRIAGFLSGKIDCMRRYGVDKDKNMLMRKSR